MTDKPTLAEEFGLTGKQEDFVYEYLVDLNATQAAIRAGYSKKTANVIGCENLAKPNVANAIAALRQERRDRYEISAANVLKEYAKIGFSNIGDFIDTTGEMPEIDMQDLTRDQLAAVSEITVTTREEFDGFGQDREHVADVTNVKFKLHSKQNALDALSKNLGLFEKDNAQSAPTIVINGRAADL